MGDTGLIFFLWIGDEYKCVPSREDAIVILLFPLFPFDECQARVRLDCNYPKRSGQEPSNVHVGFFSV